MPSEREQTPPHISINGDDVEGHDTPKSARSSSGWDGKLRIEKKLELANPEALSDPEYSEEENVVPGEVIDADAPCAPPFIDSCLNCWQSRRKTKIDVDLRAAADSHSVMNDDGAVF